MADDHHVVGAGCDIDCVDGMVLEEVSEVGAVTAVDRDASRDRQGSGLILKSFVVDVEVARVETVDLTPGSWVFAMAPPSVRQGAVRKQGFASSPTPETQLC
ncbi:MAG: hypothetical protein ACRDV4_06910 [Acidimicrobiales bacterium]